MKISEQSEDHHWEIVSGKGPHKPRETKERTFKFDKLDSVVNKVSGEKFWGKGVNVNLLLFPTTCTWVKLSS